MLSGLMAFWKKVKSASRAVVFLWLMGLAVTVLQLVQAFQQACGDVRRRLAFAEPAPAG